MGELFFVPLIRKREYNTMTRETSTQSSTATTHYDKKVAILGAGSMGRSIDICLAMHHIPTVM